MPPEKQKKEWSFKNYFVPLTSTTAIHIIIILGILVFANALFNNFVWDDKSFIIQNKEIHTFNLEKIFGPSLFNSSGYYRPVPALYFTSLYSLFNNSPFFYHVFQIAIHIINASLLFIFFKHFLNKKISLFLSLIFLIHPIQVESVSFIASTGNPLFFLFGMIAVLLSQRETKDWKSSLAIFGFLLLSMLTKETGVLFLLGVLLYRFLFKKKNISMYLIGAFLTVTIYSILRLIIGGAFLTKFLDVPIANLSLSERLMHIPEIILYYLKTFFFPFHLSINQQWTIASVDFHNFYFPLVAVLLVFSIIGILGKYIYKVRRSEFGIYVFFTLWFLAGLAQHLQIFPLNMTVADRWFYFPMVGLLGITGIGMQTIKIPQRTIQMVVYTIGIILIILLSARTMIRNTNWHNAISLYTHDRKIHTNFEIENNLGTEYIFLQQYDQAIKHFSKSVDMFPREQSLYNLGYTYELKGDMQRAKENYYKAINSKHHMIIAHNHMLTTYVRLGRVLLLLDAPQNAKDILTRGLSDYPDSGILWALFAVSEYQLKNYNEARISAEKAKKLFHSKFTEYTYIQVMNNQQIELEQFLKR